VSPVRRPVPFRLSAVAVGTVATVLAVGCGLSVAGLSGGSRDQGASTVGSAQLGWHDELTGGSDKLDVATTVAPISSIVRNIGGDRIRLRGIIPDATNSHTFEPSPSDARTLAEADLIIVNGLHLEQPTLQMAEASKSSSARILSLGDNTLSADQWLFDFSFPASAGDPNPHLWMDVRYAERYAALIRDWLATADPPNRAAYDANLVAYTARLEQLDGMIRRAVSTVPEGNRKLLTYHDSWAYWAREYGFTVIGAVQASDFSDPTPREVGALIDQIKAEGVPAVFGSEVFPSPVLEQIARESGARFIDALRDDEPPSLPTDPGHSYLGMLENDMETMIGALGGDPTLFDSLAVTDTWQP
jgi:manganese/iron transport system substrate-binding protein